MRAIPRWATLAVVVIASLATGSALAQPPGGWGGFRGGFPGGGFPGGGSPGGGFPGGGFRGGFPGGGFPGGGFPGGDSRGGFPGFGDPREMVRNADTNRNNVIDPDEFQSGIGRFLQRSAERAGFSTNQSVPVDRLVEAMDQSRRERDGYSSRSSSSSPYGSSNGYSGSSYTSASTAPLAPTGLQSFGTTTLVTTPAGAAGRPAVAMVPGFDTPAGAVGTTAASSTLPLEQRFDERVLDRARSRMEEYDRDRNGILEGEELTNGRWDPPWDESDLNKDSKINLEEMAMRYHVRYNGSSSGYGYPGFPGGGYSGGGFPGGGYPGGGYPGSSGYSGSSSSSYRPPFMISSSPSAPVTPGSSSPSSGSSSNSDQVRSFAERRLRENDRNNNGRLEREEWQGTRITEESDTNKDGVITIEEMTARMQSMMSGRGGPPGGGFDRGGDRGGDRDRGSDRDRRDSGDSRGGDSRGGDSRRGDSSGGDSRSSFFRGGDSRSGGDVRGGGDFRGGGGDSRGGDSRGGGFPAFSRGNSTPAPELKRSYRTSTPAERLPEGLPSWFSRSDTNGDGQVSMSEFSPKLTEKDAQDFQKMDANNDGVITARECLAAGPTAAR